MNLEEMLKWVKEHDVATDEDRLLKIWSRAKLRYGLTRYQATELTLKVLDRMK